MTLQKSLLALCLSLSTVLAACAPSAAPSPTAAPSKPAAAEAPAKPAAEAAKPAAEAAKPAAEAAKPAEAPAAKAPAAAGPLIKVTTGYSNVAVSNLMAHIAKEAGIFQKNGLDVDLQLISGGAVTVAALLSNQIQFAHAGGSEALSAAAAGADVAVVGTMEPVYAYVFLAPSSIQTLNDLKGTKVGVATFGGSADVATRVGLRKVGIDPEKDLTIIATGSAANRTAALLSGAIQGGMASPPDSFTLEAQGFHRLFDLAALKVPSATNSVIVQRAWMNSNKEATQKYIDSIVEAHVKAMQDKPFALSVLKSSLKSDDDVLMKETLDYYLEQVFGPYPESNPDQFADAIEQLSQKNDKIKDFDLSKLLDDSFVKSAQARNLAGR
jgi:NitT/TauT family transport system substrate-binding protein